MRAETRQKGTQRKSLKQDINRGSEAQTKDAGRDTDRDESPQEEGWTQSWQEPRSLRTPLSLPARVLRDLASFQKDRPLPVPSVPRRQPRAQKLHL